MTDNMTAVKMMVNLTSRGEGPITVARELALEWSKLSWQPKVVWADRRPQCLEHMAIETPERRTL
eukprot:2961533-Amphidinium_carterae.1